jgi:hypothetical protein
MPEDAPGPVYLVNPIDIGEGGAVTGVWLSVDASSRQTWARLGSVGPSSMGTRECIGGVEGGDAVSDDAVDPGAMKSRDI